MATAAMQVVGTENIRRISSTIQKTPSDLQKLCHDAPASQDYLRTAVLLTEDTMF